MIKSAIAAPCGEYPQGAGDGPDALPFSPSVEYVFPDPNPETLRTILRFDGCPEQYVDTITAGYAPREFLLGMTRYWKIRDAFYRLAAHSVYCFKTHAPEHLTLQQIVPLIVETMNPQDPFGLQLTNAMNSVRWKEFFCAGSCFVWPWDIPRTQGDINSPPPFWGRDLLTAIRLTILYRIWCLNPILCSVDFSLGLGGFTSEERTNVQLLISASIQVGSAVSPTEEPQVVSESTLTDQTFTAEVQQLLDILQDGEKSRQELQEKLGVGRTVLLKHFLDPAREAGLVTPTEQGSSPNQKYRLTSSEAAVNRKQVQTGSETGLKKPVFSGDDLPQKQAGLPKNGVLSPMAVSCFAGGHAPVRLARYVRWSEAERALILLGRVERFLRSSFASEEWKKLGIVNKLNANDLSSFEDFLFDSKYWGANCGVVLRKEVVDNNGNQWAFAVGESNLLNLIAQKAGLDLAVCSEAECAEMSRLAAVILPDVLHLVNFYAQRFSISRDLDKPYHGDPKAMQSVAVEPFNLYSPFMTKIVFHGKDRAPRLHVGRVDVDDRTLLLPFTFYASSKNPVLHCMMPEVPDRPALYNADAIAANSGATVILTDEIGIPLVNDSDSDFIYCSWYGGMDVHEKVVPELPPGQPCRWLCFDNGDGPVEMYEKAVKVGNMIFQHHGRKISFQVFDRATWTRNAFGMETGRYESTRLLSFDELMAEAAKYGVGDCGSNEFADLQDLSMDDLLKLKPKDFTLYPLLKEGFYCLIYGGSGVAKTWFALYLAICLSQGRAPFDGWEFRGSAPLNVMYIAGEMDEAEYGDRLRKLLAEQEYNPRFRFIRKDLDLTLEKDQKWVATHVEARKSKVVVLDNLSTLATNGHTEGQFEKILGFIRQLQANGIIVLLVHHENREGGFKGSGKIELVADQSLHLFSAGNGDKIELLVRAEKIRMTSRAEQASFHTDFDPKNPKAVWETRPLKPEERDRLDIDDPLGEVERNVGKKRKNNQLAWEYLDEEGRGTAIIEGMLNGCHDDVIAADLAVRESIIAAFKLEYGISPEALNLHLTEAKESAKNSSGKITPNKLAPNLWKLLTDNKE